MHLYAAAFGSVTPNCNSTTSNLIATVLEFSKKLLLESKNFWQVPPKGGESGTMKSMGIDSQNYAYTYPALDPFLPHLCPYKTFFIQSCILYC